MSFEAVPCMFKSRQEDGNEAQLFGLLIRPSPAAAQTQQSAPPPGTLPIAALSAGPSAIQILPTQSSSAASSSSDIGTKKGPPAKDGRAAFSHCGTALFNTNSTTANGVAAAAAALFASGTSSGMPPILPRPKNGKTMARLSKPQQLMRSLVQLPPKTTATLAFEMAQSSPKPVVSQLGSAAVSLGSCEALSVSTASSSSSAPSLLCSSVSAFPAQPIPSTASSSANPNGLLAIHSPPQKAKTQTAEGERRASNLKTPRRRRSRQTLASEGTAQREQGNSTTCSSGRSNGGGTETDGAGGGADLLGDLHSIEYSQLVNSSVITTEDYLPSQSDPIYTNMDMYSSSSLCVGQLQQQNGQLEANVSAESEQRQQKGAEKNAASTSAAATAAPSLCPSSIFMHNQQHLHQPLLGQQQPSSAPSSACSARFVPSAGAPANVPPPPSQQQPHPSHWHPYMGAHPGGPSHISSTPDSGIQSIDGSPPSVYTPPMVSPYASQVRSCESVNNGVLSGMPSSSSSTICATAGGVVPNPSSTSINGAPSFYGASAYPSLTEESLTITAFTPSSSSIFLSSSLNVPPPSLIIEQLPEGENGAEEMANDQSQRRQRQMMGQQRTEEGEEEEDFSDMPKLVPVTHTEHDEETAEQEEIGPGKSAAVPTAEDGTKKATAPLFHPGMSLHELAECLSSNISREQLKQLTSLIQRKAEEQKNNLEREGIEHSGERRKNEQEEEEKERRKDEREQKKQQHQWQIMEEEKEEGQREEEEEEEKEETRRRGKRSKATSEVAGRGKEEATGKAEEREQGAAEEGNGGKAGDGGGSDEEAAQRKARDLEQLAIYRSRVRQHLNRRLAALLERVIRRMDKCHLNLGPLERADFGPKKGWPWNKMNWEEIHRRAEARGEAWMLSTPEEMKKGRRRKRKNEQEENKWGEEVNERRRAAEKKRLNGEKGEREAEKERKAKKRKPEEEEREDDQTKKRIERKRRGTEEKNEKTEKHAKRVDDEGGEQDEKQAKRVQGERRERNEKPEETDEREEKQSTPPIILRIRPLPSSAAKPTALTTIKRMTAPRAAAGKSSECALSPVATVAKRRKPSSSPKPSCSSSSSAVAAASDNLLRERCHSSVAPSATDGGRNSANGRRWTTTTTTIGRRTAKGGGRGTTPTVPVDNGSTRRPRRRREMPSHEHLLSDQERAIVHSTGCFMIRNLSRRRPIGAGTSAQCQQSEELELDQILGRVLTQFCATIDRRFVSDRQLDELIRTVKLMLSVSSVRDPSALLGRFDSLLKHFIGSSLPTALHHQNESVHAQYTQLKQSIDFGKAKQTVPRDALSAFLDEGRVRSLSASSNRRDTFHRPLTVDTSIDLSYLDSPHPVGQWDPDKAAKLSPTSDNREHDCVRCICGIAEDDGVMSQCDRCHFWLHADCLDCPILDDQQEFVCDFCTRRIETTPRVDIVLKPQPTIKLSGCTYYRTLVNSRGLQVRLNESVYVERLINDKHKSILRELHEECVRKQQLAHSAQQSPQKRGRGSIGRRKGGGKAADTEEQQREDEQRTTKSEANRWWPERTDDAADNDGTAEATASTSNGLAPTDNDGTTPTPNSSNGTDPGQFHRRDLRVFRIERLFRSPNGQRFIFGCYYARPHETFCDSSRTFFRNELFWTPLFDTLPLDSVVGRCLVLEPQIWAVGRPKSPRYLEDDVFVCEYQIDRNQRSFEKIPPKNRYYINTEPFVFNFFENKLTMKRDFTPFKITAPIATDSKTSSAASSRTDSSSTTSPMFNNHVIRQQLLQQHLDSICSKISAKRRPMVLAPAETKAVDH